jgi:7-cyano-7-deazaguanine synthase
MSKRIRRAVVLLSGGLDSATTLYVARRQGYETLCLIFDYGQRHKKEIRRALAVAKHSRSPATVVKIALPWKGSALLDRSIRLPKNRTVIPQEIPVTYVPARNIIFLSFAASFAEASSARAIFIGANALDYSGYPDCRPAFFNAYQKVLTAGLKAGVEGKLIKVYTPLIRKTKAQIVRLGMKLKVPFHLTWSCYSGRKDPCGRCDSCLLRAKGFFEAGIPDLSLRSR